MVGSMSTDADVPVLQPEDFTNYLAQVGQASWQLSHDVPLALAGDMIIPGQGGPMLPVEAARELFRRFKVLIDQIVADLNAKRIDPNQPVPPELRDVSC
jgi:hypothetical protein